MSTFLLTPIVSGTKVATEQLGNGAHSQVVSLAKRQIIAVTYTTPVGASATSYASPIDVVDAAQVTGSVFSSQLGTLLIEQSGDWNGTTGNWDVQTTYDITANDGKGFIEDIVLPWVRLGFTNLGASTNTIRLFGRLLTNIT